MLAEAREHASGVVSSALHKTWEKVSKYHRRLPFEASRSLVALSRPRRRLISVPPVLLLHPVEGLARLETARPLSAAIGYTSRLIRFSPYSVSPNSARLDNGTLRDESLNCFLF